MRLLTALRDMHVTQAFRRWVMFSCFSYVFVVGLTIVMREVGGLSQRLSFAIPLVAIFFVNFFVLRYAVYPVASGGNIAKQFLQYAASAIVFRMSEYAVYLILVDILKLPYMLAAAIVMPSSFFAKFLWYGSIVFRRATNP